MIRILAFLVAFLYIMHGALAVGTTRSSVNNYTTPGISDPGNISDFVGDSAYNNMYPVMNNNMRVALNPGITPTNFVNPASLLVRTNNISGDGRRVVARTGTARGATTGGANTNRSATSGGMSSSTPNTTNNRRVVARSGNTTTNTARVANRGDSSELYRKNTAIENSNTSATESLSTSKCLADYTTCMNGYCARENTAYNRCYCSSRLSQIDSEYGPAIDKLIKQLLTLGNSSTWTAAEMNEYWESQIGQYTGDNSWTNLDAALDINWADTESRVRGQNAFITGHEYCVQHLRGCAYMSSNMRDVYRSDILRDCDSYEKSLQKIKNAAESAVENYND